MTAARQRQVLIALIAVLGLVVGWRVLGPVMGRTDELLPGVPGAASRTGTTATDVEVLRIGDLDLQPAEFRVGRDPFRFVTARPKPSPKPRPKPAPPPRPRPARPANDTLASRAVATPPPVDVVYLGRFGPVDRPLAVFSDGSEIFNVLEGGVVKGHFLVDKIGYESADLKFVNFPDAPAKRLAIGG